MSGAAGTIQAHETFVPLAITASGVTYTSSAGAASRSALMGHIGRKARSSNSRSIASRNDASSATGPGRRVSVIGPPPVDGRIV